MLRDLLSVPNVRLLVFVDTLLVIGLMSLSNYTALLRWRSKAFRTPEDYELQRRAPPSAPDEMVERSRRIHLNHLENVVPFLPLSVFYVLTQPSHLALSVFLWSFLGARVLYTIFYARSMQPHRTIAFTIGAMTMFAMSVLTLIASV